MVSGLETLNRLCAVSKRLGLGAGCVSAEEGSADDPVGSVDDL